MKTKCRRFVVAFLALLSLGLIVGYAEDRPGVIIYMEPPIAPIKMARSISYSSYSRMSVEFGNLKLPNGQVMEIHNPGIIGIFPLPPSVINGSSMSEFATMTEQAKDVIGRYPNIRYPVESVLNKWRAALQEAAKHPTPTQQATTSPSSQLAFNGITYKEVGLVSVSEGLVKISHSDGIATISLAALSKAQIIYLNSTSTSVHIDPDWADRKKLAEEAKAKRLEEEAQAKRLEEQATAKRIQEEAKLKRKDLLTKAKQLEEAARYEEAMSNYIEAQSDEDVKRLASMMATDLEAKKDYQAAADYFEKAGLFSEAGRIRKSYNMSESVSSLHLGSEEIFRRFAPATVTIVAEERRGAAVGSGFFVKKGGYILTNHHVVDGARTITVVVNKDDYPAVVVAQSTTPDLALLKISLDDHPILELGDSDLVKSGAQVFTIGTPKNLPKSITGGMISSTNRSYMRNEVFQISVLINHGNSGGPLISDTGKVIGVVSFGEGTAAVVDGVSIGSDVQGINYAIKVNEAKNLINKIPK